MSIYYQDHALTLLLGDAVDQLRGLEDGSVNCCVTSPPYFGLRDYESNPDQIGLEETPAEYVAALVAVFAEVWRVLANDGTFWLNLGESYNSIARWMTKLPDPSLPQKNALLIPERVVIALQDAGWIIRNKIVWTKPNARSESVKDRLWTRWEPVFLLVKSQRYFFDLDPIRVPHAERSVAAQEAARRKPHRPGKAAAISASYAYKSSGFGAGLRELNENGANPGDVWDIAVRPTPEAHFATFPVDLPRRCIAAGCKPGGVVLDPFSGAGTTALAAQQLGRRAVGIDINAKYHDIALKRMSDAPLPFGEAS